MSASPPATAVITPSWSTLATELSDVTYATWLKIPVTPSWAVWPGSSENSVADSTGVSCEKTGM